ncbi:MAG: hypothetical protein Kow00128_03200 [Deltaproteobacteria bacterium]
MAKRSRTRRFPAALVFLILFTLAGTGTPRGKFPVPATGSIAGGPPPVFTAAPSLRPHLTPDIAFTEAFRAGNLAYVHSPAFAEAMFSVATGNSSYAPREIPPSWPVIAREWKNHRFDFCPEPSISPRALDQDRVRDPLSRTVAGALIPGRSPFRDDTDRVSSLLFLSSLEFRARRGDRALPPVTPTRVRMGAAEILASVRTGRAEARRLEDRLFEIASRIVLAERLGAAERLPRDLAQVRAECRYARHALRDGTFDLQETEQSIRRAEEAADRLLAYLHPPSS